MIHILTPFTRFENLPFYIENLSKLKIIWHPILEKPDDRFNLPWIEPFYCQNKTTRGDVMYYKLNMFFVDGDIVDNDKYFIMNDDDWFDPTIIDKLSTMPDPIIFVSMKRGHNYLGGHPTVTLLASPNVHIGTIGVEQYILNGTILKQIRFNSNTDLSTGFPPNRQGSADGHLAELLMKLFSVRYEPDLFMYFNWLEKGRWNKEEI